MPLRVIGISGGSVWMTTRKSETQGWTPWVDLTSVIGPIASPGRVACAMVDGRLHICVLEPGALWHTIETGPLTFTGWGPAHAVGFPGVSPGLRLACAAVGPQLHVCIDGTRTTGSITSLPAVWRSIRAPSGAWSQPREVTNRAQVILDVACAGVTPAGGTRPQLDVLARTHTAASTDPLVHTTLLPTGSSSGEVEMIASIPPAAGATSLPAIRSVAAAGIGSELHVVLARAASGGVPPDLFFTIATGGVEVFGNVRALVADAAFRRSPLVIPACANVGGNLHLCAISGKRIMHTIRLANGLFRNPESSAAGMWGDVTAVVPGGPGPNFDDVACAGDPI